ncbi:MAG TPA: DAK2 domain-containing protein, partial [Acidimicrobiales bacterium]|nr:DAK2 domain-containing protein [Acidimicrobiales bacterium]
DGAQGMPAVCKAVRHGSLMGARGNSGVILSQIMRGLADTFERVDQANAVALIEALGSASERAYEAVMRPVEGTILTVARAAAEAAARAGIQEASVVDVLDAARKGAAEALERTPELLPVLRQAGVVDAGGAGLLLLLDSFLAVAAGRPLPQPEVAAVPAGQAPAAAACPEAHDAVSDLRYEVMYLLEARDEAIPAFKDVWSGVGDSIVVVGGDGIWNCHIHTDDIGAAVEAGLDAGRPRSIRVTDLVEQVEEERWVRDAASSAATDEVAALASVTTAVVAVGTGEGIGRIFRSLGVQRIVAGGQSMNPATAQILEAVNAVPAEQVIVLPNNKNIVPVAEQVAELTDKAVRVVPTKGIAEGFAALLAYDPEAAVEDNARSMDEAAARVVAGEVTRAVRSSASPVGPIAEGDWLGLSQRAVEIVAATPAEAACGLLDRLVCEDHEIVTVIEGEGATPADTRRITEWLAENRRRVSAEVHHGGQPLYPYLFSIE